MVRAAVRRIIAAAVVLRQLPTRAQHTAAMSTPTSAKQASATKRLGLAGVRHAIAVASGKGGVGKSTVAGVHLLPRYSGALHALLRKLVNLTIFCSIYMQYISI